MSSWDPVWEDIHSSREWGKYPIEELIRFVARNYYSSENRQSVRFLDLGCGEGSASWYISREGFAVSAIDGSSTAIDKLKRRLDSDGLKADLAIGDVSKLPYSDEYFDCVVDLMCLMCNDVKNTARILSEVNRVLKPGGRLFSFTPQTGCWGDGIGDSLGNNTYKDSEAGPFSNMGVVRFCSEEDIVNIYEPYFEIEMDYTQRTVNNRAHKISFWAVSGIKK